MTRRTLSEFTPHLHSSFTFVVPGTDDFEATLVEAEALSGRGRPADAPEGYVLLFKSQDERVFAQNLFQIQHPEMGELEIFIVPVARDDSGVSYEAIFN